MKIKAAVLEQTGDALVLDELELTPPRAGEVLVRLGASGVCHSDLNAIDGTAPTRSPAVLGHEGARNGAEPVYHWPGDRVAIVGRGGVGLSALMAAVAAGAAPVVAVDSARSTLDVARELGATGGIVATGSAEETAEGVREASGGGVDYAIEATGRPEAMLVAFLSTRARGAAVLIGIPREDAVLTLPALSIPRLERRVLGSIYGSSHPDRDFAHTLDLYRRGRLPLDRLISHRLPLEQVGRAFELMRSGKALRAVLCLEADA